MEKIITFPSLLLVVGIGCGGGGGGGDGAERALARTPQFTYQGSFKIPPGSTQEPKCNQQAYSFGTIAYRAADNSIFVTSHGQDPTCVGLFAVPESLVGEPTAVVIERVWARIPKINTTRQTRIHGLLWDGPSDRLCWTQTIWYNVSNQDAQDAGCVDHGAVNVSGPWEVGSNNKISGPIADAGDGKALIGLTGVPGAGSSNFGPAAYELDLASPTNVLPLMEHTATLREKMADGRDWLTSLPAFGSAIIDDTLVWSVEEGEREFYGNPADFEALYGFAPRSAARGYHHDPYSSWLYLYDRADLEAVRAGQLAPTDVHPYAYRQLTEPSAETAGLGGMTVDTAGRRLLLASQRKNLGVTIYVYGY